MQNTHETAAINWIELQLEALKVDRSEVRWIDAQGVRRFEVYRRGGLKTMSFPPDRIARIANDEPGIRRQVTEKLRDLFEKA